MRLQIDTEQFCRNHKSAFNHVHELLRKISLQMKKQNMMSNKPCNSVKTSFDFWDDFKLGCGLERLKHYGGVHASSISNNEKGMRNVA